MIFKYHYSIIQCILLIYTCHTSQRMTLLSIDCPISKYRKYQHSGLKKKRNKSQRTIPRHNATDIAIIFCPVWWVYRKIVIVNW